MQTAGLSCTAVLPIMMATKALPEMEAERAQLAAEHQQTLGSMPISEQMSALQVPPCSTAG